MLKFCKLRDHGIIPTRGTDGAAGWDLTSAERVYVPAQSVALIPTGIGCELPWRHMGLINLRSGFAVRSQLIVTAGVIDEDYRGEISVAVFNPGGMIEIKAGTRFAQLVVLPYFSNAVTVPTLSSTVRGEGGYGSTG